MSSPSRKKKLVLGTLFVLLVLLLCNSCLAAPYEYSYKLLDNPNGNKEYRLTVSISESLYEYYSSQDHNLYNYDFSKFVTPDALQPIADDLWTIYKTQEDFANGVLMIVHQIPYVVSDPQKFSVETLAENEGDCDLFTIIAASIMKAGGLDVVMLLLEEQEHMLLGVNLPDSPQDARTEVSYYTYDGKKYYCAETTGGLWKTGWRVGEAPDIVDGATAKIIPLRNYERTAPAQVSSSYSIRDPSQIVLAVSTGFAISSSSVEISGSLSPSLAGQNVTLYVSSMGSPLTKLTTVETDANGHYSHIWYSPPGGIHTITANWSGDEEYTGSDSTTFQLIVVPYEGLMVGGLLLIFVLVLVIVSVLTRGAHEQQDTFQEWDFADYPDYS
ncbi:MAG: Ig-like domain-containing protein [Candidatus Bathyarchaeota archaeon]|nr:Ig-like domain-containing protein [Candidatus Bathyarchaeota archaeon]